MRTFKWIIIIVPLLLVAASLHYILPRHEVVRIIGVTEQMQTLGINRFFYATNPSGEDNASSRDIRLIETMRTNEQTLIFRNEDTGWIWPPYFKFDAADMQARGRDAISDSDTPKWVAASYYGVRSEFFSIYPNVLKIRPVDGPDVTLFPWTRTIFFLALASGVGWLWFTLHKRRTMLRDPGEAHLQ